MTPSVRFDLVFHACCKLFLYGLAPFHLGIWTGPFLVGDTKLPLSSWKSGPRGCHTSTSNVGEGPCA